MSSLETTSAFANLVAVTQVNSIDFLNTVLALLEKQQVFIPLKNEEFASRIDYLDLTNIIQPDTTIGWYSPAFTLPTSSDIAQISYTSGTEGEPKGIVLSHKHLNDTVVRLIDVMQIDSSIREYIGVPVYHSFGYGRVRVCNKVGGSVFIPEVFNPSQIASMLEEGEINAISAVPTQWRFLLRQKHLFEKIGSKVKWIEIGSQYMSESEKAALKALFPLANIVQHYGLTEASRTTFLSISEGKHLETVGKPTGDCQLRVSPEGLIEVKGSHVADHKITSQGVTKLTDDDGWFTTSDLGEYQDEYLTFLGRADDIINIGGLKVSPEDIERELLSSLSIDGGVAVTKTSDSLRGETILLCVLNSLKLDKAQISEHVAEILSGMGVNLGTAFEFQVVEEFPVTDTGKLRRRELTRIYEQLPSSENVKDPNPSLISKIRQHMKLDDIQLDDSFLSLNGDSLLLTVFELEVEEYLGYIPENWQALSFAQIDSLKNASESKLDVPFWRTLAIVASVFALLLMSEIFWQARSYYKQGRSALNFLNDQSLIVFNEDIEAITYRPNFEVKHPRTGELTYEINALGLRSPAIDHTPMKGETRIAVVGASSIAGVYAPNNSSTIPAMLEGKLRQTNSDLGIVNVINGGIQGANLDYINNVTQNIVMPLRPQYTFIYTGMNDLAGVCRKRLQQKQASLAPLFTIPQMPNWLMSIDMLKKNTVFMRHAPVNSAMNVNVSDVDFSIYKRSISNLASSVRDAGSTPILMTNARAYENVKPESVDALIQDSLYFYTCFDKQNIIAAGRQYNDVIREIAQEHRIDTIDLATTMPGGNKYFVDGGHFTYEGKDYVADQLAKYLLEKR